MTIRYISTRGQAPAVTFEDAVLAGLAPDGGLYVPETLPEFSPAEIAAMRGLSYAELACRVMRPFIGGALDDAAFTRIVEASYREFRHEAVAPLVQVARHHFVLELFHGPTLAFKDFALQFLGRLLDALLEKHGLHATILGATSGDTGSAAIAGCRGRAHMDIFILYPDGRPSEVQRRQMTTWPDANIHNLAVRGTFDDCQDIVKALFSDADFRTRHRLVAVNSINWARILAQVVYYFYAALSVGAPAIAPSFCVPTGNFGDIFAGYIAKRMGLPVKRLIIATNCNDILARCLESGAYAAGAVQPSLSPSMDIQVSSNFERLLFDLYGRDGAKLAVQMQQFRAQKRLELPPSLLHALRRDFAAHAVSNAETAAAIRHWYKASGYLPDPHSAVGLAAAQAVMGESPDHPVITLATAHPAKFPEAVEAATGIHPALPPHMADLFVKPERFERVENDAAQMRRFIEGNR